MRTMRARRVAGAWAAAVMLLLVGAAPVHAQTATPPALACGRVVAYTPPTAGAAGSITLGTTTFALKAGSEPNPPTPIVVGAIVCLDENQAGEIFAKAHLVSDTICSTLAAITPASASAPGSITLQSNRQRIISVRPGTSLAGAQVGSSACFTYGFNSAGDPEVRGFVGAQPTASPPVRQLPSTSTNGPDPARLALIVAVAAAATAAYVVRRRGFARRAQGAP